LIYLDSKTGTLDRGGIAKEVREYGVASSPTEDHCAGIAGVEGIGHNVDITMTRRVKLEYIWNFETYTSDLGNGFWAYSFYKALG
jgi:hypothetical protein